MVFPIWNGDDIPWIVRGSVNLAPCSIGLFCLSHSQKSDGLAVFPHDILQPSLLTFSLCRNTDELLFREESHGPDSSLSGHMFCD